MPRAIVDAAAAPFAGSRGKGLQPRSMEVFHDLGVIDRLSELAPTYVARGNGDDGSGGRPVQPDDDRLRRYPGVLEECAGRAAFLDEVGATRVHAVPASDEVETAEEAAAAYADTVRAEGEGFDILMLGVGPDGHIASLFPGHPALDVTNAITAAVHDSPKPPPDRVTLTFEALRDHSQSVWFLVSGEAKADAVARALAEEGLKADMVYLDLGMSSMQIDTRGSRSIALTRLSGTPNPGLCRFGERRLFP